MAVKVAINGFGRIGRNVFRAQMDNPNIDIVAINDITDNKTLAHLLKHDSVMGNLAAEVSFSDAGVTVDGKLYKIFSERDPAQIPWNSVGAEIVIESTGFFTKRDDAAKHLGGSVKKVVISAPAKGEDITVVLGVNDDQLKDSHQIISNASCTTNCLAPVAKVLHDTFGINKATMTTIHSDPRPASSCTPVAQSLLWNTARLLTSRWNGRARRTGYIHRLWSSTEA